MNEDLVKAGNVVFSWLIQKNDVKALCRFYDGGGTFTLEQFIALRCVYNKKDLQTVWKEISPLISSVDWSNLLYEEIKKQFGVTACNEFFEKTAIPMSTIG